MPTREDIKYEQEFGHIPNDIIDRIAYILGRRATDQKFNTMIQKEAKRLKRIKWKIFNINISRIINRCPCLMIFILHNRYIKRKERI